MIRPIVDTLRHLEAGCLVDDASEKLAETLHKLRGPVVLSGYRSALYDALYKDWRCVERHAHADGARDRVECLWLSPRCPAQWLFETANGRANPASAAGAKSGEPKANVG